MKLTAMVLSCLFPVLTFAAHPAADRVKDFFEEAERINNAGPNERSVCRLIDNSLEHRSIATRLLGSYATSSDSEGVKDFKNSSDSVIATRAMPEIKKLTGSSGSYLVDDNAVPRGNGFAVKAKVTANGKNYSLTFVLSSAMKISDIEMYGFSGIAQLGKKFRKDIDKHRASATPVSDFMKELRADSDFVNCH